MAAILRLGNISQFLALKTIFVFFFTFYFLCEFFASGSTISIKWHMQCIILNLFYDSILFAKKGTFILMKYKRHWAVYWETTHNLSCKFDKDDAKVGVKKINFECLSRKEVQLCFRIHE